MRTPANTAREEPRDAFRQVGEYTRVRPAEASERFALDPQERARGMDYLWVALSVRGAPNRDRLTDYYRAGWKPCRAGDHKSLSGIDVPMGESLAAFGLKQVAADDPVIRNGMMLCQRPQELSKESRDELEIAARSQIADHLAHLARRSERDIGARNTVVSRRVTRSDTPPPEFAEDGQEEA